MNKRKIYFRADASATIGYGHFVRTLALADMLKDEFDCAFFTQIPTPYQIAEMEKVCPFVVLDSETKFDDFLSFISGDEIVVLDNYFYTSEYQKNIKEKGCKLVCIDDIHDRHFYADVIINHCISSYSCYDAEDTTKFFLGVKWALLRTPFLKTISSPKDSNQWVISFGGSDPYNLTFTYVKYLKDHLPSCQISLLLGDAYSHLKEVEAIKGVSIYSKQSAQQVADLFLSVENVICSASTVCYEALSCGCRVFAGYYVDNQIEFYNNLSSQKLISPLGNLLEENPFIDFDFKDDEEKPSFSDVGTRYINIFNALSLKVVDYPTMTSSQSFKTWKCRNLQQIRQWMTNQAPFSFDMHSKFLSGLSEDSSKLYYSFFDEEIFVGSYDFVDIKDGESAERGLFVNPEYQGQNVATMMELFLDGEIVKRGVKVLLAEVLKNNIRSYRFHLKLGYTVYKEDDNYFFLKRKI